MTDEQRYAEWKNKQDRIDLAAADDNRPVSTSIDANGWRTDIRPDGSVTVVGPS